MQPKRYIVWSENNIDFDDPWQRKWYIQQVLTHGWAEDIAELNREEIKKLRSELNLQREVRCLWEDYFDHVAE